MFRYALIREAADPTVSKAERRRTGAASWPNVSIRPGRAELRVRSTPPVVDGQKAIERGPRLRRDVRQAARPVTWTPA